MKVPLLQWIWTQNLAHYLLQQEKSLGESAGVYNITSLDDIFIILNLISEETH